jgi:hypothetical protein
MEACAVEDCDAEAKKRGWCYTHYNQWHRYGAPTPTVDLSPNAAQARADLEAGLCPYCGRGPYRVVAGHVWRAHEIDGRTLREDAGLPWSASVCDPSHADLMRDLAIERGSVRHMEGKHVVGEALAFSPAGLASQRANGAASGDRRRRIPVESIPSLRQRRARGESYSSIARDFGVTPQAIRNAIRSSR